MATTDNDPTLSFLPSPVLASTLYASEQPQRRDRFQHPHDDHATAATGQDWKTGIKDLDRDLPVGVFGGGRVVGFGGVGLLHVHSLLLIHSTITTHLLDTPGPTSTPTPTSPLPPDSQPPQRPTPSIFILEPPTTPSNESSLLQIYELLELTLSQHQRNRQQQQQQQQRHRHNPTKPRPDWEVETDIDALVDRIALLPYFDLIGISQSLTEIGDGLAGRRSSTRNLAVPASDPVTDQSTSRSSGATRTIILLRGLGDTLSQQSARASSVAQTASMLSEVLRQLRRLAVQKPGETLVLIEVGVGVVEASTGVERGGDDGSGFGGGLRSAFSSVEGRELVLRLGSGVSGPQGGVGGGVGTGQHQGNMRGQEVLAGLLEGVVDGLVVVHDGFGVTRNGDRNGTGQRDAGRDGSGSCIVEVMKDRMGDASGVWAAWETGR